MNNKYLTFEDRMNRIEVIVQQLERGDAPLKDSMDLFEEGTALLNLCSKELNEAEMKVTKLLKSEDGLPVEVPFEEE